MKDLPSGLYDELVTLALQRKLNRPELQVQRAPLSPDTASEALARHIFRFTAAVLSSVKGKDPEKVAKQIELTNKLLDWLAGIDGTVEPEDRVTAERLLQVLRYDEVRLGAGELPRPSIPLRHSDLIVNGPKDLRVGREIQREIVSADRVDVLVSFVKWTGFVEIRDALRAFSDRHGGRPPLRVLTTTYMGATDHEALDALRELGAEVRVSYDARRTRLHAKAWLFHRETGFSTGIIGSSNLSHAALRDGCEWNVRLSNIDNAVILRKFEATFAQYWQEGAFEAYDRDRFIQVLAARRNPERDALAAAVRLHPYPHQTAVLEALAAERSAGHHQNLVVAATGTGKTVIAALDYKALCKRMDGRPSLLFVAHRREILEKSRATYRAALGDGGFGELLTGSDKPLVGRHVFASIQSLHGRRLDALQPDAYDVVVVDEFHHSEADTYTALLERLKPRVLLGLTATPERTDGQSILHWFDHRVAAESRLWDALDQGLLVPFQYFGVDDQTDLSHLDFRAGRYSVSALERVYTADEHRAEQVLRALADRVRDPTAMRALGFCVSVKHAEFMAAFFNKKGLPALAVTGDTKGRERQAAVRRLAAGELCALFTVDVFNEGVDIPAVDTVLFLRPTESATLYLQQLGRGLRLHDSKSCLTVLDFIGRANRRFRFDRRFRAMLGGGTRAEVRDAVEKGFPRLPSGCSIQLEEEAQRSVLENIKRTLSNWSSLAEDLVEDWPLGVFLDRSDVHLRELYLNRKCYSRLREKRGYVDGVPDNGITRALPRLLHVDDLDRLTHWRLWLSEDQPPEPNPSDPFQLMLFAALGQAQRPLDELGDFFTELWSDRVVLQEVRQLLEVLDDRRRKTTHALCGLPFRVHATYSRDEVSAGLVEARKGKLLRTQGGVYRCEPHRCDVLYVTLEKDEKDFTPTTLYNDYPLSQRRFHWESQGTTRFESDTGRRYRQPSVDWRILLFVRQAKKDERKLTMPYLFLGPVRCVSAKGERPIQIVWELEREMPPGWFNEVKIAAG
jgi:superfamily II DNA or RNA helicase